MSEKTPADRLLLPQVTPGPRGEAAARPWDGTLPVTSGPGCFETNRTRDAEPQVD